MRLSTGCWRHLTGDGASIFVTIIINVCVPNLTIRLSWPLVSECPPEKIKTNEVHHHSSQLQKKKRKIEMAQVSVSPSEREQWQTL